MPGSPDESLLVDKVDRGRDAPQGGARPRASRGGASLGRRPGRPMPASRSSPRRAGADWWSLRPIRTVSPPTGTDSGDAADAATGSRRRSTPSSWPGSRPTAWRPAPAADPATLIRRVTFDLTGLPPTPEAVDAFVAAVARPAGYETLVDRLLASPQYGERWGRHWLDVVRFGESQGTRPTCRGRRPGRIAITSSARSTATRRSPSSSSSNWPAIRTTPTGSPRRRPGSWSAERTTSSATRRSRECSSSGPTISTT